MAKNRSYGNWTPIKTINSYAGLARFYAELQDQRTGDIVIIGEIPLDEAIPSPYGYSQTWGVYQYGTKRVFIRETAHKRYDVFEVPADFVLLPVEV